MTRHSFVIPFVRDARAAEAIRILDNITAAPRREMNAISS